MKALFDLTDSHGFKTHSFPHSFIAQADCFLWLSLLPPNCIHGVVTDPPYGVREYDLDQLEKRKNGNGGIWRLPPKFDGHERSPLPRFTALSQRDRERLREFFRKWGELMLRVLRPGGHIFLAANTNLSNLVFSSLADAGFEFRGEIIRLVSTLRGGDRPKNAEGEFPDVSTLPRGGYEPWGLLRKPIPKGMTVGDCLRTYRTGGIRRMPDGTPFKDVINSTRTPRIEKEIAAHPTLKPQEFLRQIVYAALPRGDGLLLDPFMGSGSTVAAAGTLGIKCIGIERNPEYFKMAVRAIPKLAVIDRKNGPHLPPS